MTKKPSEKNKAWEKERRDRLNKSFDSLAKLLPNYDPSIVWTKIEIIQKSILYIDVLQQRNKKYLSKKDPQELKKYNELLDAIKYFQLRNGQLSELLKKSKIALPPFSLPKYLSDNKKLIENNEIEQNDSNVVEEKIIKDSTEENLNENITNNSESNVKNKNVKKSKIKKVKQTKKCNEKSKIVTVTSTVKPDIFITKDAIQENNTTLNNAKLSSDKVSSLDNSNIKISTKDSTTNLPVIFPTLIKIENLPLNETLKNPNSNQIVRKYAKDQHGKIKILPQPHLKLYYCRADGKMPIPVIRKKIIVPVKKRKILKRKVFNNDVNYNIKKIKLNEDENIVDCKNTVLNDNEENYISPAQEKVDDMKKTKLDLLNVHKSFRTLSPTAAFLESFPVVASTTYSGKLYENTAQLDVNSKVYENSKTTESSTENLENLNNFFSTKEYSNYCAKEILDEKKLDSQQSKIELESLSIIKKPEIKILENIKIEINKTSASQQTIKTEQPVVVTTVVSNLSVGVVCTTSISSKNPLFTTLTMSPSNISITSCSSMNMFNYISTPSTMFSTATQFVSGFPEFSSSIARQANINRNSCKFNLSTKGPICTPLPLDSKNLFTQNYSTLSNFGNPTSSGSIIFPQTSLENFNNAKTGNRDDSTIKTTNSILYTNNLGLQNIPKTLISSTSTSITNVTSQNVGNVPIMSYKTVCTELQINNSLPITTNSKIPLNFKNYQTSFENFNLKTYSAASNVSPEVLKKSKTLKNSKLSNPAVIKSKILNTCTSTPMLPSGVTSSTSNPKGFYPTIITTLNENFRNINASTILNTSNSISNLTNLDCTKTNKSNENNVDSNIKFSTCIQSDTFDVKYGLSHFIPSEITSNNVSNITYSPSTSTSILTNVKNQSHKFQPYSANLENTIANTVNISSTYSQKTENATINAAKPVINPDSSINRTNSCTVLNNVPVNTKALITKLSDNIKVTTSNLNYSFYNTKSRENIYSHPDNSTISSTGMSCSTNSASQILLRPYDIGTKTTTPTTTNYLSAMSYTTTKQTFFPAANYTFTTCSSSASNFQTKLINSTINNNSYSSANTIYSNSKNYFYPLQNETSTTFSFSLTTTTNTQLTAVVTPKTQSLLTYSSLKTDMPSPWIPPEPTSVVRSADFKTPFTFSLTPTTSITTKSIPRIINSALTSNHLISNSQIPLNSYNSTTNFTFCLTTPKSTVSTENSIQKLITPTTNVISKTNQSNFPNYNINSGSKFNFIEKDTTNFTFALTKSINSVSDITSSQIISHDKFESFYGSNEINSNMKNSTEILLSNTEAPADQFKTSTNKIKTKMNKKINEQNYYDCEQIKNYAKAVQKSHVNWMTSTSENISSTKATPQYFPTQNNDTIFPWSQNKIYDNNLQQTFYGDTNHYLDFPINSIQNLDNTKFYNNNVKTEKFVEPIPPTSSTNSSNINNNFFSVSQLVDQSSESSKNFENTQSHNQGVCQLNKISPTKHRTKDMKVENQTNNLLNLDYSEQQREQKPSAISNIYSAEALISKKEKHHNFIAANCNNNLTNPTEFYSDSIETMISDPNSYHTNNYFYNYHHQQSMNQNYTIQSENDYLGGTNVNSYENDKKLFPPSSYQPPISSAPPSSIVSSISSSNSVNTNVNILLPYDTNYCHVQYYPGTTTTTTTTVNSLSNSNYQTNNWTKGLQYTNSSCVVPQYNHNQQVLPIIGDHHAQSTINTQTVTGNLTNFNLSSICPEINDKVHTAEINSGW